MKADPITEIEALMKECSEGMNEARTHYALGYVDALHDVGLITKTTRSKYEDRISELAREKRNG